MKKRVFSLLFLLFVSQSWATAMSDTTRLDQLLCAEDSLLVNGTFYYAGFASGTETILNGSMDGSDSIILVDLDFMPPCKGFYYDTFCASQTILLFGKLFSPAEPSADIVFPAASSLGCDSTLHVFIDFNSPIVAFVTDVVCPNDTIWINGTAYDHSFYIGEELVEMGAGSGCDSLIEIHLQPSPFGVSFLSDTLFEDETFEFFGEVFNKERKSGEISLPNMAQNGCDSVLKIQLEFIPRPKAFAFIPNAFQLNADNSTNSTLQVGLHPDVDFIEYVEIYDRWGGLVFYEKKPNNSVWDGSCNGKTTNPGVYLVNLVLVMLDGHREAQCEAVTLFRG